MPRPAPPAVRLAAPLAALALLAAGPDPAARLREALRAAVLHAETASAPGVKAHALARLGAAQALAGDAEGAKATLRRAAEAADALKTPGDRLDAGLLVASGLAEAGDKPAALARFDRLAPDAAATPGLRWRVEATARVAAARRKAGDRDGAFGALRALLPAVEAVGDDNEKLNALLALVRAQAALGDFEGAFRTAGAVGPHNNWLAPVLQEIAPAAEAADPKTARGVLDQALDLAATMTDDVPRGLAQMRIAQSQAKSGDTDGALKTARGIGRFNTKFDSADDIPLALAVIAVEQAKRGDRAAARKTAREAFEAADELPKDGVIRPERLRRVAEAEAALGDLDAAARTVERVGNGYEQAYALLALGRAQAKAGDKVAAGASFARALEAGLNLKPRARLINEDVDHNRRNLLNDVAAAQAAAGDPEAAEATVLALDDPEWQANAFAHVAGAQAEAGDPAGALTTARHVRPDWLRSQVLAEVAEAQAAAGDASGALDWAATLPSPEVRSRALAGLARGLARLGAKAR